MDVFDQMMAAHEVLAALGDGSLPTVFSNLPTVFGASLARTVLLRGMHASLAELAEDPAMLDAFREIANRKLRRRHRHGRAPPPAPAREPSALESLPASVQVSVCQWLPLPDLLCLERTCRDLMRAARDPHALHEADFHGCRKIGRYCRQFPRESGHRQFRFAGVRRLHMRHPVLQWHGYEHMRWLQDLQMDSSVGLDEILRVGRPRRACVVQRVGGIVPQLGGLPVALRRFHLDFGVVFAAGVAAIAGCAQLQSITWEAHFASDVTDEHVRDAFAGHAAPRLTHVDFRDVCDGRHALWLCSLLAHAAPTARVRVRLGTSTSLSPADVPRAAPGGLLRSLELRFADGRCRNETHHEPRAEGATVPNWTPFLRSLLARVTGELLVSAGLEPVHDAERAVVPLVAAGGPLPAGPSAVGLAVSCDDGSPVTSHMGRRRPVRALLDALWALLPHGEHFLRLRVVGAASTRGALLQDLGLVALAPATNEGSREVRLVLPAPTATAL